MKKMINETAVEGFLYEHTLEQRVTGDNSKNPGTPYIRGTVSIATDSDCSNVIKVHYTFVTATTASGKANATYGVLEKIVNGAYKTVLNDGKENAAMLHIDSAIGLNEFYSDRNGKEELVSAKINNGGFIRVITALNEDEKLRNTFKADMIITGVTQYDADEENGRPAKAVVRGAIFDFRKSLLPVEFTALNPKAIDYFVDLNATQAEPVFTKVWGRQMSQTLVRRIVEESAFGDPDIKEVKTTNREFVITGVLPNSYDWDAEDTILASEVSAAMTERETYLATLRARQEEYQASKNKPVASAPAKGAFNF